MGDPRFLKIMSGLKRDYDRILVNTSENIGSDLDSISSIADGVIIVVDVKETKKRTVLHLVNTLEKRKVKILGYISAKR